MDNDIISILNRIFPYPKVILSLFLISLFLTILYIYLSLKIIKQENEEKAKNAKKMQNEIENKKENKKDK